MNPPDLAHFKRNRLSIITYNYDRSFERFFLSALMSTYGVNEVVGWETLRRTVKIVHVYGQLGPLVGREALLYGFKINETAVRRAMENIRIVPEGEPGGKEFEIAQQLIADAEIVIFLGFGYHPQNVDRLNLPEYRPRGKGEMYGTVQGLSNSELSTLVQPLFKDAEMPSFFPADVLAFLRNHVDLFRKP